MRVDVGSRFRNPHDAGDFVRVAGDLACLCDSYEFPFSAGWCPAGARLFGDAFATAAAGGLDAAVAAALAAYNDASPRLYDDDGFGPGEATATFLAVSVDDRVHLRWIGDHAAMLVRDGAPVCWTEPHALVREFVEHGLDPRDHPASRIVTRSVGAAPAVPDAAAWDYRPGDALVIASGEALLPFRAAELAPFGAQRIADAVFDGARDPVGIVVVTVSCP